MDDSSAVIKKLRLENFHKRLLQNKPADVWELDGIAFDNEVLVESYDLIFSFVFSLNEMQAKVKEVADKSLLSEGGYLYLAYPKRGNKKYQEYIERDSIFPCLGIMEESNFVGGTPLKFSKMVSLGDTFTIIGLRCFMKKSPPRKDTGRSLNDYIEKIPDLRARLKQHPETLARYDGLSYGYQKDWARYVYSTKVEATQEKHLLEMADILAAGFKTKGLYLQSKK